MADWANRIVGHGEEDPRDIAANPRNWRIHPLAQGAALEGVLREVGWIAPVTINRTTGYCLDGHLRVALAVKRGMQSVPVQYVELSEEEEALALATLDPLSAMAETDEAALRELVAAARTDDAAVRELLDELAGGAVDERAADRELEAIDLERLPQRPVWVLITIETEKLPEVAHWLEEMRKAGVCVEISNDSGY